ncbi:hypothetical protein COLE_04177 [Cutaneotrichosporon oleaginosum]|nr:hypothetical protein COLE_04177 [Cutaneotrichosporon oleaginosum]
MYLRPRRGTKYC